MSAATATLQTPFHAVGVDVGGTKIAAGRVSFPEGNVQTRSIIPTWPERGGEAVLERNGARHPVPGLADADQRQMFVVDVGAWEERVEDRVRTASQSWRKGMFCSYSAACCPGPSNVIQ